jgi:hypothetical protein
LKLDSPPRCKVVRCVGRLVDHLEYPEVE